VPLKIDSAIPMNNEVAIPRLGLGMYRSPRGRKSFSTVLYALQYGYRHVDTAALYHNEREVGDAIRESGIPREQIFITTKLWNQDQGYDSTMRAFDKSMKALNLGYLDLYLIHWPVPGKRRDSWKAMQKIYQEGRCRSIGVSNYLIRHLSELLSETAVVPVVNQVEFSPFLYQKELLDYCRSKGIVIEAYSPITKGKRLDDPNIVRIANQYHKTSAQILIRWALQQDLVVLVKSNRVERIEENGSVFDFEITPQDMTVLNSLNENYRTSWDPTDVA
jgi:diketogulonate reductase-like aldo/keto reductase